MDGISIGNEKISLAEKINRLMSPKTAWEVAGIVWDDEKQIYDDYVEIKD